MTLTGLSTFTDTAEEEALLTICPILLCAEIFFSLSCLFCFTLFFQLDLRCVLQKYFLFLRFFVIRLQASQYMRLLAFAK